MSITLLIVNWPSYLYIQWGLWFHLLPLSVSTLNENGYRDCPLSNLIQLNDYSGVMWWHPIRAIRTTTPPMPEAAGTTNGRRQYHRDSRWSGTLLLIRFLRVLLLTVCENCPQLPPLAKFNSIRFYARTALNGTQGSSCEYHPGDCKRHKNIVSWWWTPTPQPSIPPPPPPPL